MLSCTAKRKHLLYNFTQCALTGPALPAGDAASCAAQPDMQAAAPLTLPPPSPPAAAAAAHPAPAARSAGQGQGQGAPASRPIPIARSSGQGPLAFGQGLGEPVGGGELAGSVAGGEVEMASVSLASSGMGPSEEVDDDYLCPICLARTCAVCRGPASLAVPRGVRQDRRARTIRFCCLERLRCLRIGWLVAGKQAASAGRAPN